MLRQTRVPRILQRLYVATVIAYIVLGFVFAGIANAQHDYERIRGGPIALHPVINVPTGNDDKTVQQWFYYLQLRHLQQQTETFTLSGQVLLIIYGILGAVLLISAALIWSWYERYPRGGAGLYPVEVYNAYITERGGAVDLFVWANYAVMAAFAVWYIWWNLTFGQWN